MKPITLYWTPFAPNPPKVLMILEELGLPYHSKFLATEELKKEPYTNVNPNGRVPAIEDPNTGITIWESTAIVLYLIDTYDKEEKLTYSSFPEKYQLLQWSIFQVSGQGPYFGQAAWFHVFHPEPVPSAKERYANEIKRVAGVLNTVLKGKDWLVGDKCTFADLSFFMWNNSIAFATTNGPISFDWDEFPEFKRWHNAMAERPAVKKTLSVLAEQTPSSAGTQG